MNSVNFFEQNSPVIENEDILGKRRRQIVKAAAELFSQNGFHRTTMRDISKLSGINLSQLYNYITSKDEILYLFYRFIFAHLYSVFESLDENRHSDPVSKIKFLISSQLEVVGRLSNEFLTMYTESRHLNKDSLKAVLKLESTLVSKMEEIINEGIEQGFFARCDAYLAANIIQYLVMMEPMRGWNLRHRYSFSGFSDSMTALIMNLLGAEKDFGSC
ncbi:MAG: TetR/AcrR family transcriptional regulator [Desulfosalsimonas sp.]